MVKYLEAVRILVLIIVRSKPVRISPGGAIAILKYKVTNKTGSNPARRYPHHLAD
jgi:hypothetical protein